MVLHIGFSTEVTFDRGSICENSFLQNSHLLSLLQMLVHIQRIILSKNWLELSLYLVSPTFLRLDNRVVQLHCQKNMANCLKSLSIKQKLVIKKSYVLDLFLCKHILNFAELGKTVVLPLSQTLCSTEMSLLF